MRPCPQAVAAFKDFLFVSSRGMARGQASGSRKHRKDTKRIGTTMMNMIQIDKASKSSKMMNHQIRGGPSNNYMVVS